MNCEESASPTVALESVMITGVIDAHEHQDVATVEVPNAFMQTHVKCEPGNEWVTMKIQGLLVNMLVKLNPGLHEARVVCKNGKKTVCIIALKAIHGMLQTALSFYKQFRSDLEAKDHKLDPCNLCVANKKVCGKQHTITFHVDDLTVFQLRVSKKNCAKNIKWRSCKADGRSFRVLYNNRDDVSDSANAVDSSRTTLLTKHHKKINGLQVKGNEFGEC